PRRRPLPYTTLFRSLIAEEVVVRGGIAVVAAVGAAEGELPGLAHFRQDLQIPIDGAEANMGNLLPDFLVDPVRGGMLVGCAQDPQDRLPLAGVAEETGTPLLRLLRCHNHASLSCSGPDRSRELRGKGESLAISTL